jgi:hypothetical protein
VENTEKISSGNGHLLLNSPMSEKVLQQSGTVKVPTMPTIKAKMEEKLVILQQ